MCVCIIILEEKMAFKLVTVLCATFAFAHGGLLPTAYTQAHYSPANEVSHVYSSVGSIGHQPVAIAHGKIDFLKFT